MDPKLLYWTGALINLIVIVTCALIAVRRIRRRDVRGHRRMMLCAATLVTLFLLSYVLKRVLLGAEDRGSWAWHDLALLYVHEFCIAVMLVGGVRAAFCARRLRAQLGDELQLPRDPRSLAGASAHRIAGRAAVIAGLLALLTAAGVLAGMYARSAG
jgi:uncharacterized membrane protein YozB (DUF420 family)